MIVLYVQNGYTGARYLAKFEGPNAENIALAFMEARAKTHHFSEDEKAYISPVYPRVIRKLYPTCEHGMSQDLCMGPDHYPTTQQEMMGIY